jgi:hypothetical protein
MLCFFILLCIPFFLLFLTHSNSEWDDVLLNVWTIPYDLMSQDEPNVSVSSSEVALEAVICR